MLEASPLTPREPEVSPGSPTQMPLPIKPLPATENPSHDLGPAQPVQPTTGITQNRIMGDLAGTAGNVSFGDSKTVVNMPSQPQDQLNASGKAQSNGSTINNRNVTAGEITGTVHGNVSYGDNNYNINLNVRAGMKMPDFDPNTNEALQGMNDYQIADIKKKVKDVMDNQLKDYQAMMPSLMENMFTPEQRESKSATDQQECQAAIDDFKQEIEKKIARQAAQFSKMLHQDPSTIQDLISELDRHTNARPETKKNPIRRMESNGPRLKTVFHQNKAIFLQELMQGSDNLGSIISSLKKTTTFRQQTLTSNPNPKTINTRHQNPNPLDNDTHFIDIDDTSSYYNSQKGIEDLEDGKNIEDSLGDDRVIGRGV